MSNTIQSPVVANGAAVISQQKTTHTGTAGEFSTALSNAANGTPYSDAEVKAFFASNPSTERIAKQAASLGLTESQMIQAMQVGGYRDGNPAALKTGIEAYVADTSHGYAWDANGGLVETNAVKAAAQGIGEPKAMPSAASIKAFFATGPSDAQQTAMAKQLGLTPAQLVQAQVTGSGAVMGEMHANVLESMYVAAAKNLGVDIGGRSEGMGGANGGWTSYFSPTLGRAIGSDEIQQFMGSNPTQAQIFQKASQLGVGMSAINNMLAGQGKPMTDPMAGSSFNRMAMSLYQGTDGFSTDQTGHIVANGGKTYGANPDGSGNSWMPKSTTGSGINTTA